MVSKLSNQIWLKISEMIFLAMNIQLSYNPVFLLTVLKCYNTDYFEYR